MHVINLTEEYFIQKIIICDQNVITGSSGELTDVFLVV